MPRPAKITEHMRERIAEVALMRRQIPTDKQLAKEAGVSVRAIQFAMRAVLLRACVVSRGTETVIIGESNSRELSLSA